MKVWALWAEPVKAKSTASSKKLIFLMPSKRAGMRRGRPTRLALKLVVGLLSWGRVGAGVLRLMPVRMLDLSVSGVRVDYRLWGFCGTAYMETTLEVEKAGFDGDSRKSSSTYYLCAQDICAAVGELDERSG